MTEREAQRRRTRRAIVDAAGDLLAQGASPTMDDVAAAADVSRRTVYLYFPTLDQLMAEAAQAALLHTDVDAALEAAGGTAADVPARVLALIDELVRMSQDLLPLGRRLIRLTVDSPHPDGDGVRMRRGYRRIEWIERAVTPLRDQLPATAWDRLVSGLATVISWEAMIVLQDTRGLADAASTDVMRWAARALLDATLADAGSPLSRG